MYGHASFTHATRRLEMATNSERIEEEVNSPLAYWDREKGGSLEREALTRNRRGIILFTSPEDAQEGRPGTASTRVAGRVRWPASRRKSPPLSPAGSACATSPTSVTSGWLRKGYPPAPGLWRSGAVRRRRASFSAASMGSMSTAST